MKSIKMQYTICIHVLFAAAAGAFMAALACNEYVIAGLSAAAYSVLKALYWAVEKGGIFNDV